MSVTIEEIVEEVPQGKSYVCWLDGSRTASSFPIATDVRIPCDDEMRHVRTKSVPEVLDELVAVLGKFPSGAEVSFGVAPSFWLGGNYHWPAGRIVVNVDAGTSQGHFVHVAVVTEEGLVEVILGKTLHGRAAAQALARRLAELLGA